LTRKVLILGGYGNFGKRIAVALAKASVPVIISGRDFGKAEALRNEIGHLAECASFDANTELADQLTVLKPCVVVNTCGPFQTADYGIAQTCISHGVHYIDLADGRDFVADIAALDRAAKAAGVSVICGASTVPTLSSAVLEHFKLEFSMITKMRFGISPGQKSERGLATTQGILTYVGKRLRPFAGHASAYGWQGLYRQHYPGLGYRWMANCEIPDLDILPSRYGMASIQFSAGLELGVMHLALWSLSWLVRLGLPLQLSRHAATLLKFSHWFDRFGTGDGGMHVAISGRDQTGAPHTRKWFIIARDGSGPHIPTVPAIVLARKIACGEKLQTGAYAAVACVTLEEYLRELQSLPIATLTT
jgi:Saccharopine dehydrogenase NADP binding domain